MAKAKKKKARSAEKQYLDFTHKTGGAERTNDVIDIPRELVHIGKAIGVIYESDKFDGKKRHYVHRFKKKGDVIMKPESKSTGYSDIIIFNNLKCKITPRGITG